MQNEEQCSLHNEYYKSNDFQVYLVFLYGLADRLLRNRSLVLLARRTRSYRYHNWSNKQYTLYIIHLCTVTHIGMSAVYSIYHPLTHVHTQRQTNTQGMSASLAEDNSTSVASIKPKTVNIGFSKSYIPLGSKTWGKMRYLAFSQLKLCNRHFH